MQSFFGTAPISQGAKNEAEDACNGFFGDLGGVDDALEVDVDTPPPEARPRGPIAATAADLEALSIEPQAPVTGAKVSISALFSVTGESAGIQSSSGDKAVSQDDAPPHHPLALSNRNLDQSHAMWQHPPQHPAMPPPGLDQHQLWSPSTSASTGVPLSPYRGHMQPRHAHPPNTSPYSPNSVPLPVQQSPQSQQSPQHILPRPKFSPQQMRVQNPPNQRWMPHTILPHPHPAAAQTPQQLNPRSQRTVQYGSQQSPRRSDVAPPPSIVPSTRPRALSGNRTLMPSIPGLQTWIREYSFMSAHEVDELLSFNMRNLHCGELYVDDYYYHAHQNKYYNGINKALFRPKELFALAPHERAVADTVAHARVEGLGRFVFSSLRAPRQLLSVTKAPPPSLAPSGQENAPILRQAVPEGSQDASPGSGDEEDDQVVLATPRAAPSSHGVTLHTVAQVAARKVIEDCDCQLLDVDDVDRVDAAESVAAAPGQGGSTNSAPQATGPGSERQYREQRRHLLMEGVADALTGGGAGATDGVFQYVIAYPKGRRVVAQVLRRMFPPGPPRGLVPQGAPVMHLVLRNARMLFGGNVRPVPSSGVVQPPVVHLIETTVAIAMQASVTLTQMQRVEDVLVCLEAFSSSDIVAEVHQDAGQLGSRGALPLLLLFHSFRVDGSTPWPGVVLCSLFERALALCLHVPGHDNAFFERFSEAFLPIFDRFLVHLMSLRGLMERVAGEAGAEGALESLRGLAAGDVLQSLLGVCNGEQEAQLVVLLQEIVSC